MWKGGIAVLTPKACARCGEPCPSSYSAWRHCQKPRAIPAACRACGREHATTRGAIYCCMQVGQQRVSGYAWRESNEGQYRRRRAEIRGDAGMMAEIRRLAEWLLEL